MIRSSNILLLSPSLSYSMDEEFKNDNNKLEKEQQQLTSLPMSSVSSKLVKTTTSETETITSTISSSNNCDTTTIAAAIVNEKKREKFSKDSNGERIRDSDGYRLRAAGLCTRQGESGDMEILLVSGRGNSNSWVLPGGGIEEDENAQQAAIREVHEEAGIRGTIRSMVGEFKDDERLNRTILYILNVIEECDDYEDGRNGRQRCWMTISEAIEKIKHSQRVMLQRLSLN